MRRNRSARPSVEANPTRHPPDGAETNRLRQGLLAGALIAVIVIASYAGSVHNGFVWDDNFQIVRNPYLHSDRPWLNLVTTDVWGYAHPEHPESNYYRPLQMLTYRLLAAPDLQPVAYHWVSILINFLACWAAWAVVSGLSGRRWLALVAALLFAAHPVHSEAVLWISALSELGCALFYFLAFYLYLEAWREREISPPPAAKPDKKGLRVSRPPAEPPLAHRRRRIWFVAGSAAAFFLSLLWKEMALSFPFVVAVCAIVFSPAGAWKQRLREAFVRSAPFWAVMTVYILIRLSILGYVAKIQQSWALTPSQYALSIIVLVAKYWRKLLWPVPLNAYYVFEPARQFLIVPAVTSILFVAIVLVLFVKGLRRWPLLSFAVAWLFLTLVPVLNLNGVGENVFTERYLYIPSLGFCVIVAWLFAEGLKRIDGSITRSAAIGVVAVAVIAGIGEVRARTPDWRDDYDLLTATLKTSPHSAVTHNGLGEILRDQKRDLAGAEREFRSGYSDAASVTPQNTQQMAHALAGIAGIFYARGQAAQSLEYVDKAIAVDPSFAGSHVARGVVLLAMGRLDEAEKTFEQTYNLDPNNEVVADGLGLIALSRKQNDKALQYFSRAVNIDPSYADGYDNLGRTLSEAGRFEEALPAFDRALELAPSNPLFHLFFGMALGRAGRLPEARAEFERTLAIDPSQERAKQSLRVLDQMEAQRTGISRR